MMSSLLLNIDSPLLECFLQPRVELTQESSSLYLVGAINDNSIKHLPSYEYIEESFVTHNMLGYYFTKKLNKFGPNKCYINQHIQKMTSCDIFNVKGT